MSQMEEKRWQQEEEPSPSKSDLKKQESLLCEECKENPSKYKCPGCSVHSCSLICVNAHKQRTACTGKRKQTHCVPLSQFDDSLLLSDFNLLEEVKRVADSARRRRTELHVFPPHYQLPNYLQRLRFLAARRGTKLLLFPSGMSKREKNQTRYNPRKKSISWTIEWRFQSTGVVLHDHGVREDTKLCSVIAKHLKPGPWNHPLKQFCVENLDSLKFFICKNPEELKSPFCELDIKASLRQQLANVVIVEYPAIHVFLPSHKYDFEVIRHIPQRNHGRYTKDSIKHDPPNPGILFREEEIEDGADNASFDPQVCDLMKDEILSSKHQTPHHDASEKSLDCSLVARDNPHSSSKSDRMGMFGDMEFDFDQGLMDAYSDLMAEINPDDFLDLEGVLSKAEEERYYGSGSRGIFSVEEELEEGEIAE